MPTKYSLKSSDSFKELNKSQTNHSKSKQTYSFGKQSRFNLPPPFCPKNSYGGELIERRKTGISIGKSKRSQFTKSLSISPGVAKYTLSTLFNQTNKKQGFSIGMSREKIEFGSYVNKEAIKIPSPNRYNNQKKQRTISPKYSLRPRTRILDKSKTLEPQNNNPGPGYYDNPQIKMSSRNSSKFANLGYSTSRSKRFSSADNKTPGPGNYKEISNLSNVGKYIVSSHIGGTRAIFSKQKRISKFQEVSRKSALRPGPGHYRSPSQFGCYDGDIHFSGNQTIRSSRISKRTSKRIQ